MLLTSTELKGLERIFRLNIVNSVTGVKPANLIGTISSEGVSNLAIFSSVVHLGSDPALIGFIVRPSGDVRRHTYENIRENGEYTINHVHPNFVDRAHFTSAKFPKEESEFKRCQLTEEFVDGFNAPFVQESSLKLGMRFLEEVPIKANGTSLIIGTVEVASIPDYVVHPEGHLNLERSEAVGISGLNSYYTLRKIAHFPYARPDELPDFDENGEGD